MEPAVRDLGTPEQYRTAERPAATLPILDYFLTQTSGKKGVKTLAIILDPPTLRRCFANLKQTKPESSDLLE